MRKREKEREKERERERGGGRGAGWKRGCEDKEKTEKEIFKQMYLVNVFMPGARSVRIQGEIQ